MKTYRDFSQFVKGLETEGILRQREIVEHWCAVVRELCRELKLSLEDVRKGLIAIPEETELGEASGRSINAFQAWAKQNGSLVA